MRCYCGGRGLRHSNRDFLAVVEKCHLVARDEFVLLEDASLRLNTDRGIIRGKQFHGRHSGRESAEISRGLAWVRNRDRLKWSRLDCVSSVACCDWHIRHETFFSCACGVL